MNNGDLISREALKKDMCKMCNEYYSDEPCEPSDCVFFNAIKNAPAVDAVEVVHAKWVNPYINFYGHPCHCCSECGFKASYQDKNYCPNCGARMQGGSDE